MRGQTKMLAVVGAGLIVAGIWYGTGERQAATVQDKVPVAGTDTEGSAPSVAAGDEERPAAAPLTIADRGVTSTDTASPSPRRIEESASGWGAVGDGARPRPAETHEPVTAMTSTDLPGERAGLSGVLPNLGPPSLDDVPATAKHDLPPNTDKDALAELPVLPTVEAVDIARSGATGPNPAGTSSTAGSKVDAATPDLATADAGAKPDAAKPAVAETAKPKEHVVKAGETFSSISLKELGSVKHVNALMKANPGKDPKKLFVGTKVIIPELPGTAAASPAGSTAGKTDTGSAKAASGTTAAKDSVKETFVVPPPDPSRSYTVQPGEGWFEIARKFLGKGENYPELYEYNKERVGGDPHLLRAGTVIELPPSANLSARSAPQPATAQPATPPAK